MNEIYDVTLADSKIRYSFQNKETKYYFYPCIKQSDETEYDIRVSEDRFDQFKKTFPNGTSDYFIELHALIGLTSAFLLKNMGCIFHGVAFIHRGYAWILTGPSGVGKTTQFLNWYTAYPGDISILNGDKPILKMENSRITVYPSPWNGKERMGDLKAAPLAGIVVLKQGNQNELKCIDPDLGIRKVFSQFWISPETNEEVYNLAAITDCIFRHYPVYEYMNLGNQDSTDLLKKTIEEYRRKLPDVPGQTGNCIG